MKTMKKLMALALVFTLVLAMAATVSAGTITVKGSIEGVNYAAYRVLDVVYPVEGDADTYYLTPAEEWKSFWYGADGAFAHSDYFTVTTIKVGSDDVDVLTPTEKFKDDSERAGFAVKAKKYADDNSSALTPAATAKGNDEDVVMTPDSLPAGYYLLTGTGTNPGMAFMAEGADIELREKNALPVLVKEAEYTSLKIGDVISYTITVDAEENIKNEKNYVIHDKMGEGLSLINTVEDGKNTGITVTLNGEALTEGEEGHYTVAVPAEDGDTFDIVFTQNLTTKAYDKIKITYQAKIVGMTGLTNDAELNENKSTDDEDVYTYEFTLSKVDQNNSQIDTDNVIFELYADEKGETPVNVVIPEDESYYRPAGEGETGTNLVDFTGSVTLKGFAAGTYYLKEKEAPDGYVKTDAVFTIDLIDIKDTEGNEIPDGKLDVEGNALTIKITNVKAETLPETGGIGTTMFYMVGSVLATGALTLLVTKKRVEDEA